MQPGPDGLNAAFYKSAWPWVGKDVLDLVTEFYQSANMPSEINKTHIGLIPKIKAPVTPKDFRPISLCNCWNMIRIITLVLWGRLEGPRFGHVY
jgi:hypothetical protein